MPETQTAAKRTRKPRTAPEEIAPMLRDTPLDTSSKTHFGARKTKAAPVADETPAKPKRARKTKAPEVQSTAPEAATPPIVEALLAKPDEIASRQRDAEARKVATYYDASGALRPSVAPQSTAPAFDRAAAARVRRLERARKRSGAQTVGRKRYTSIGTYHNYVGFAGVKLALPPRGSAVDGTGKPSGE